MIRLFLIALALLIAGEAQAQDVLQYLESSTGYPSVGQVVSAERCEQIRQANLTAAPGFGYTVDEGRKITDPASGIWVRQTCVDAPDAFTVPPHPLNAAAPPALQPTACPAAGPRVGVLIAFGQSNSANHLEHRHGPSAGVYAFQNGACYVARDPLPGASGTDGSLWVPVARGLIDAGMYDSVVIAAIGEGGSACSAWQPGGSLYPRLMDAISSLRSAGFEPNRMAWQQGEADTGGNPLTTTGQYIDCFQAMLTGVRNVGVVAPVYIAQGTVCNYRGSEVAAADVDAVASRGPDELIWREMGRRNIRTAQYDLPEGGKRPGPNTDTISPLLRVDGCHFGEAGQAIASRMWVDAILASP